MSDINVKQIRKAAELLGMKPKDLIDKYDIGECQNIIKTEIKSDFEEKVESLLAYCKNSKLNIFKNTSNMCCRSNIITFNSIILFC